MVECNIGLTIVTIGPGIFNVLVRFYLDKYDEAYRIRDENAWAELVEVDWLGNDGAKLVDSTRVNINGEIYYIGVTGTDNDAIGRKLRIIAHYFKEPGPEYVCRKDFKLYHTFCEEGEQGPTVPVGLTLATVSSKGVLPWSSGPMGVGVKHYMRSAPGAFSALPWGSGSFATGIPHYMSSSKKAF